MTTGCRRHYFYNRSSGIPDIHNVFTPNGDGTNDYFSFNEYGMTQLKH